MVGKAVAAIRKVYKSIISNKEKKVKKTAMKKRQLIPASGKKRDLKIKNQKKDFSDSVVAAMLLLLVIISILSVAFYLHALNTIKPTFVVNEGRAVGEVSITITKAPADSGRNSEFATPPEENNLNSKP